MGHQGVRLRRHRQALSGVHAKGNLLAEVAGCLGSLAGHLVQLVLTIRYCSAQFCGFFWNLDGADRSSGSTVGGAQAHKARAQLQQQQQRQPQPQQDAGPARGTAKGGPCGAQAPQGGGGKGGGDHGGRAGPCGAQAHEGVKRQQGAGVQAPRRQEEEDRGAPVHAAGEGPQPQGRRRQVQQFARRMEQEGSRPPAQSPRL